MLLSHILYKGEIISLIQKSILKTLTLVINGGQPTINVHIMLISQYVFIRCILPIKTVI